ncbi:diphosphoinositol polyphosphate phosphohydrolase 3-beta-like [Branchiostoma floridae]|uniref:diphosphoinositol-polyphosphate diphosphatase n=1 Tax=Branchiostoma floridae TaxID=7739 RepID=A0A9J7KQ92_BRAFL|nr:diphosphoinositol polyphosphate phosphohydrolase 3-beta-like [Branchiostoma floridae]
MFLRNFEHILDQASQFRTTMKPKENQVRTYDADGFRKRAACLCLNTNRDKVLLVSSSRYPDRWVVPGGGLEPEEQPSQAAIREVAEEAGVTGVLDLYLGEETPQGYLDTFENTERKHRTMVYLVQVTELLDDWEDSQKIGRKRKWFSFQEAQQRLAEHKPVQKEYIIKLLSILNKHKNGRTSTPNSSQSSHSRPAEEHCRGGEDSGMDSRNGHRSSTSLEGRMQQNKKHECSSNIDSTGQSIESHVVGAVSKHRLESSNSQTSNRLSTLAKNCDTR